MNFALEINPEGGATVEIATFSTRRHDPTIATNGVIVVYGTVGVITSKLLDSAKGAIYTIRLGEKVKDFLELWFKRIEAENIEWKDVILLNGRVSFGYNIKSEIRIVRR